MERPFCRIGAGRPGQRPIALAGACGLAPGFSFPAAPGKAVGLCPTTRKPFEKGLVKTLCLQRRCFYAAAFCLFTNSFADKVSSWRSEKIRFAHFLEGDVVPFTPAKSPLPLRSAPCLCATGTRRPFEKGLTENFMTNPAISVPQGQKHALPLIIG